MSEQIEYKEQNWSKTWHVTFKGESYLMRIGFRNGLGSNELMPFSGYALTGQFQVLGSDFEASTEEELKENLEKAIQKYHNEKLEKEKK